MTDRIKGLTVILDHDYRDDDVEDIVKAIRMIKGVKTVENHMASAGDDYIVKQRTAMELFDKIYSVYKEYIK